MLLGRYCASSNWPMTPSTSKIARLAVTATLSSLITPLIHSVHTWFGVLDKLALPSCCEHRHSIMQITIDVRNFSRNTFMQAERSDSLDLAVPSSVDSLGQGLLPQRCNILVYNMCGQQLRGLPAATDRHDIERSQ